MITGVLIFVISYILISARRLGWLALDRPAGALLGALACVAFGVLTPNQALAAVDSHTILLLFGMMGMGAFLALDGFFERAADLLSQKARTPKRLLGILIWTVGPLSALITNDAVCILCAPLVVGLIKRHRLSPLPFLLALASAANTGSVATLVGNPQNMLCANLGGLSYRVYLLHMLPVAIVSLAINHLLLRILFRKSLCGELEATSESVRVITKRTAVALSVIGGTVILYMFGADLAWTSVGGCIVLLLVLRTEPNQIWQRIDWSVLLFFAGLFVLVEGFVRSGATTWLFQQFPLWPNNNDFGWLRLSAIFLIGSNIVSNVPFILVVRDQMFTLPNPTMGWELLAMASTFAGNLTFLGSVANIIVAEKSTEVGGFGFWDYLRLGLPLALITTLLGTLWFMLLYSNQ